MSVFDGYARTSSMCAEVCVCVCVCVAIESVAGIAADGVCVCLGSVRNRECAFGSSFLLRLYTST